MNSLSLSPKVVIAHARAVAALENYNQRVALKASLPADVQQADRQVKACLDAVEKAEAAVVLAGDNGSPDLAKAAQAAGEQLAKARTAHARLNHALSGIGTGVDQAEQELLDAAAALQPLYRDARHEALAAYAEEMTEAAADFAAVMRRGYALSAALGHALRPYLGAVVIPGCPPYTSSHLLDQDRLRMPSGATIDLMEAWRRDSGAAGLHDQYQALHATTEKLKRHEQRVQDRTRAEELATAWNAPPKPNPFPPMEPLPPAAGPKFVPQSWSVSEPGAGVPQELARL